MLQLYIIEEEQTDLIQILRKPTDLRKTRTRSLEKQSIQSREKLQASDPLKSKEDNLYCRLNILIPSASAEGILILECRQ